MVSEVSTQKATQAQADEQVHATRSVHGVGRLMPDKTWKAFERRIARFFGTNRKGPMQEKDANDINHPYLHVQCKHSVRHAVINIWDKAKAKTKSTGKMPVVALGVKGRKGFWLLIHSSDLKAVAEQRKTT